MKPRFTEILFLTSLAILLMGTGAMAAAAEEKAWDCAKSDLLDHQCHFDADKDSVDLNASTIKVEHGGRLSLTEHPVPGKDTEWESAKIVKLGNRPFLEFQIWDAPVGSTEAQSLRWITFEIVAGRLNKIADEIIQERSRSDDPAVQEFVLTERDDFGLNLDNHGHVQWHHKNKKRIIK